jgi:hypothetical protein
MRAENIPSNAYSGERKSAFSVVGTTVVMKSSGVTEELIKSCNKVYNKF